MTQRAPYWVTPRVDTHINNLYGTTPDYRARLIAYADARGWKVSTLDPTQCLARLATPGHRCNHDYVTDHHHWVDHAVWLHRGLPNRPTAWALLAQPYSVDRDEAASIAATYGAQLTVEPDAPYGHGTLAVLLEGRERP